MPLVNAQVICKIITEAEVCTIIDEAAAFQKPMRELRCALESVDSGCPNQHYTKYVDTLQHTVQLKGHPLVCSNDGGCHSQLQFIRSAATHYPVLHGYTFSSCVPGNRCSCGGPKD